ncbi:sensor histidine kinase [Mechercharimyces sp. CAU 1602]|uniref:sensor histidine kinase n=1 Tax=Mechercharimyces sp. CAU 1602 TaxID=2973933 RepID=UPI002162792F|nr:sensor histidine kinase [Mechercharimyces sp. CAU 1602]MCS1349980.1 sensor histidine kinase [Mechercharimyces sp. CAU 1602]
MNIKIFHSLQWKWILTFWLISLISATLSIGIITYASISNKTVLGLLSLLLFVGTLFGLYTAHRFKQKLRPLQEGALYLFHGHLFHRIPVEGNDEIAEIALKWNKMAERLESQVSTLQKLTDENKKLFDEAKQYVISEERNRLARDLHDSVSQQLFAISMTASAILKQERSNHPERKHILLEKLHRLSRLAQSEMRALLLHLRPVQLEGEGLADGITRFITEWIHKTEIEILNHIEGYTHIPPGIEKQLFYIFQEAMSNVFRHSEATTVTVKGTQTENMILLSVQDNGNGFVTGENKSASYGLTSMKERAQELGGAFSIISLPGKGTKMEVRIPISWEE